jgi:hypothetical protein
VVRRKTRNRGSSTSGSTSRFPPTSTSAARPRPARYWWAVESWGTKWNAIGAEIEGDPASGRVVYRFETANSTPDVWLFVVSRAHPALTLRHEFGEEFDHFAGRARVRAGELEHFEHLSITDLNWIEFEEYD